MTIHVNIGEAKARFSELVAAAVRGEEIVVEKAGVPQIRFVAVEDAAEREREAIRAKREAAFGMWEKEFAGLDLSIEALKSGRGDPEERFRRKFESPD
ncbi:type II toxin-antitoxin system prevent-host-death family antitoxin [Sphingomonas naphthae]|uniref:Antitoxin n=1 Tax=Sphingomonas naphthae TaxID=1813468 RepID=A0ABY7TRY2_9SPHN|nr:type II toxin-antitoxin system prevent-host-death family antitoxin [Sphingomonas naphthae]WCT75160.1 type II toxin-antitoxin system prevent-host-death family antitoxin [Sphingomonas naphthae]